MNNCRRISRRVVLTSAALSLGAGTKPTFSEAVSTSVLFQEAMPAGCRIESRDHRVFDGQYLALQHRRPGFAAFAG